ncbi:unnamed protein product [Ascophyllum nodosum]
MSDIPFPAVFGTVGFAVGCVAILIVLKIIQCTGKISKDNTGIGFTVVIMSCISLWLLWLMAWFHQWHPLITPEYP